MSSRTRSQAATVDVYTGVDDNILRQLDLTLEIADPGSSGDTLNLSLSVAISAVNEDQSFEAPADAKPLDELIPGGVGAIAGGLGALGAGGGSTAVRAAPGAVPAATSGRCRPSTSSASATPRPRTTSPPATTCSSSRLRRAGEPAPRWHSGPYSSRATRCGEGTRRESHPNC